MPDGEERRWTCPACGAAFDVLAQLAIHVRSAHPEEGADLEPTEPEPEPFRDFDEAAERVFRAILRRHEQETDPGLVIRLLGTVFTAERRALDALRRVEVAERESRTDTLTGLANRRGWVEALATEEDRCRRHGFEAAVLVLDVDGLKEVNDAYGHRAGDDMLRRTAQALVAEVRAHDAVARVGGDEFGVLAVHCPDPDALGERVLRSLEVRDVPASLGAARRPPGDLHSAWERADAAMYELKRRKGERR